MIGKMQDLVTAAVVVSAADNKAGSAAQATQKRITPETGEGAGKTAASMMPKADNVDVVSAVPDISKSAAEQNKEEQEEKQQLSPEFVSEMTKELNDLMSKLNCDLEFQYHKEVGVMSVKMVDKNTKEVIKEYPPEDMVEGMIKAQEWLGAFLDKKV